MTKLMSTFIAKIQELNDADQDLWAETFLEQLAADEAFDLAIDSRPDVLKSLVDEALADIEAGRVSTLTEADFGLSEN